MKKVNNNKYKVIWLQGVFSEDAIKSSKAISPAANQWQYQLIKSLIVQGMKINYFGHKYDQLWPRGKLKVSGNADDKVNDLEGDLFYYLNVPFFRNYILANKYEDYLHNKLNLEQGDIVVTYNNSFICDILKKIKNKKNFKWVSIVADLNYPIGADGYIYLSWDYYCASDIKQKKIHIDGGIKLNKLENKTHLNKTNKVIMYVGEVGGHGGLSFLVKAFDQLKLKDVELWICGKGYDSFIEKTAKNNHDIKIFGYVTKERLHELSCNADIFVNPRQASGNENNFPSKILHYLSYLKPVITTSSGLSNKYHSICNIVSSDDVESLKIEILKCLNLSNNEVKDISEKIQSFNMQNTWSEQAKKFKNWLEVEII